MDIPSDDDGESRGYLSSAGETSAARLGAARRREALSRATADGDGVVLFWVGVGLLYAAFWSFVMRFGMNVVGNR